MWNPRDPLHEDDDSWEVRAFAQDTTSLMGTTWPPRSYTCTFCRREFRSAQALGGHMNVHRRDRARLHHHRQPPPPHHHQELLVLYHLPTPDGNFTSTTTTPASPSPSALNACGESSSSPSTLVSPITPFPPNNLVSLSTSSTTSPSFDFQGFLNSSYYSTKVEQVVQPSTTSFAGSAHEDLDLELRLGNRPTPT